MSTAGSSGACPLAPPVRSHHVPDHRSAGRMPLHLGPYGIKAAG